MKPYSRLIRHQGNSALFRAIEASVLSTLAGVPLHLHVEGLRGTGKTTILRSARSLFPRIKRIKGCLCNCDPQRPHCPAHVGLGAAEVAALGVEEVPLPFLEISHSAKTGTVVGTIDLARISDPSNPVAALLPGTIAQAHRGIIFVDEINRLADTSPELADILLDVMGTKPGRIQIEESGLPTVEMPVNVSVWAASNPDEDPGPLETIRRQLSDRFDFVVTVSRPSEVDTVRRILAQAETVGQGVTAGPSAGLTVTPATTATVTSVGTSVTTSTVVLAGPALGFAAGAAGAAGAAPAATSSSSAAEAEAVVAGAGAAAAGTMVAAGGAGAVVAGATVTVSEVDAGSADVIEESRAQSLARVRLSRPMQDFLARLYVDFGLESLRAIEAVFHGSRACAALDRRERVSYDDIAFIVPLAFQHRVETNTLARITDHIGEKIRSRADRRNRDAEERAGADEETAEGAEGAEGSGIAATGAENTAGATGGNAAANAKEALTSVPGVMKGPGKAAAPQSSGTVASRQASPAQAAGGVGVAAEAGATGGAASASPQAQTGMPPEAGSTTNERPFDWSHLFHRFREWIAGRPQDPSGPAGRASVNTAVPGVSCEPPRIKDPSRLPTLAPMPGTVPSRNLAGKPADPGPGRNIDEPVPVPVPGAGGHAGPESGVWGGGGIANPLEYRVEVPPHVARPLSALSPENLVRTEEELFHR